MCVVCVSFRVVFVYMSIGLSVCATLRRSFPTPTFVCVGGGERRRRARRRVGFFVCTDVEVRDVGVVSPFSSTPF